MSAEEVLFSSLVGSNKRGFSMGIVEKIDEWLGKKGKDRAWLSSQLGFSVSYIDGLLNGHFGPSVKRAQKITDFVFATKKESEKNKITIELMKIEKKERKN